MREATSRGRQGEGGAHRGGWTSDWSASVATGLARLLGHLVGWTVVAVLFALPMVGTRAVELSFAAIRDPAFSFAWTNLAIHLGLAACAWALVVWSFHHFRSKFRERRENTAVGRRGNVMVETLAVIVPFLLLVSGLAQLSLRNVAGILADLAVYQGTRTAWVWQAEGNLDRNPADVTIDRQFIRRRARLASAAVLAPTAPSSFEVPAAGPPPLQRMRGTMYATFAGTTGINNSATHQTDATDSLGGGTQASRGANQTFARALDTETFRERAARKLTFAYLALDDYTVHLGDPVAVEFTYRFNVVFPWFAYIFGGQYETGRSVPGGREGWYVDIERPRPGLDIDESYRLEPQVGL